MASKTNKKVTVEPYQHTGMVCTHCGTFIYSRAGHDFISCTCGKCSIDGGFGYIRVLGNEDDYVLVNITLNVSKGTLYDDWNYNQQKYGKYPVGKWPKEFQLNIVNAVNEKLDVFKKKLLEKASREISEDEKKFLKAVFGKF